MFTYCYLCSEDNNNISFPPTDDVYISIHHLCFRKYMSSIGISNLGRIFNIESNKSSNYYLEIYNIANDVFLYIPKDSQTEYMCNKFISYNGALIEYVRDDLKTLDLCLKAIEVYPYAYNYVPLHLKTPENNILFLEKNKEVEQYLPKFI